MTARKDSGKAAPADADGHVRAFSTGRRLSYAAIFSAFVLTFTLAVAEGILRALDFGYSPHFARRVALPDGTSIFRENRWCTAPFFTPELVRVPQPMRLPVAKRPGTFRVFVLGSSAAMGDPEASFSLARVLDKMLSAAYPDINVEVVNAGITAINSHLVRGIAEDCAALEPDLFIVYEGNNEVIGPFGPAGVFTPFLRSEAAVRLAVLLKSSRSGQAVAQVARALAGRGRRRLPDDWGGMEMFLKQQFAADDPRLEIVRGHFRANLEAITAAARRAGAGEIVSTVAVNSRTFAPFASLHRRDLGADGLAAWDAHWAAAARAERVDDLDSAEGAYTAALALDDQYAELHYRYGRLALRTGREALAREHLQRAVDLDALRFRTDSTLNGVIRSLASEADEQASPVRVVDAARALDAASPHGLAGDEFFYEHVHLTLRGTYELAKVLLPAVQEELARRGLAAAGAATRILTYDEVRIRLGFTAYEQGMIAAEMLSRLRRPPFTAQSDHVERLARWERQAGAADELLRRPEALPSLRGAMELAITADPNDAILARNTGMMLVARGAMADAVPLLQRARGWIDDDPDTLAALSLAERALGDAVEADALLEQIRALDRHHPVLSSGR